MNRKNNRQFQSSAARMEGAILELIHSMPLEKITVRLLCEKAGVNRSTFYAHYMDLYDMLEQMESRMRKDLMKDYPVPGNTTPLSRESFLPFLRFIRGHRKFYQAVLKTRRDFPLKQGFAPLWNQVIRPLCLDAGITNENEMLLYFIGFQAGFTMILRQWVDQGCTESEEKIAEILQNIVPAVWQGHDVS